jgi:putative FmdB family regulatory protein
MTYEFRCKDCDHGFEVQATIAEKEAGLKPLCPNCGSQNTVQRFSSFGMFRGNGGTLGAPTCGCGSSGSLGSTCCG